ncbi:hypothetical protein IAU60_005729 [Kwoniella sp. DSM 27419]
MPSLVTSRSSTAASTSSTSTGHRGFSRVNSFQRNWDDDEPAPSNALKGSSGVLDWSPSPERVKRKGTLPPMDPPTQPDFVVTGSNIATSSSSVNKLETAADRRRKAILAAMSQNAEPSSSLSSGSTSAQQKPAKFQPPFAASSLARRDDRRSQPSQSSQGFVSGSSQMRGLDKPQVNQELPSLTSLPKRALPWEEEHALSKRNKREVSRSNSGGKAAVPSAAGPSSGPGLSIKQKVTLSAEQQKVLSLVVQEGKNIFFTGSAGTGKSVLLRELIKNLRRKFSTAPDAVAVTASTGIAACNIGGVTLHSFGGVGLALEKPEILLSKLRKNKKAAARWARTKVLIIDEVSMVDGEMFDKFCKLGQLIRKNQKPFGGIQIVVTGDFFQLPPVTKSGATPRFCFEAQMWSETISMSVNLTKVFRQKDQRFIDMLNEMRFGKLSPQSIASFRALSRPIPYDGIEPTELFPRREDVDRSNATRLNQLGTDGFSYSSTDGGVVTDPAQREKLLGNFMAPQFLELKVDCQVMLIKNMDETLVNGSMGRVIGFAHKGFTNFDSAGRWDPDGHLAGLDEEERFKEKKLRDALQEKLSSGVKPLPVVRFSVPGGGTRDWLVEADTFKAELPNGEVQASRTQLPLILAWAMSIHKSQGQTLDRVKVDLGKVFEKGQAYVALSRATSLEGLQVLGFTAEKVMAHRKVAVWSETLQDLNV